MQLKLDENLPAKLAPLLAALGHDVDTVPHEQLQGRSDPLVWQATQDAGRFLITQDMDFSDIRQFRPGTHRGILLLRLRTPGRTALTARLLSVFRSEDVETWHRCFVVATERKIRVVRPSSDSRGER
jgi:predicted nuclease of predicted toxin-antitoxin system